MPIKPPVRLKDPPVPNLEAVPEGSFDGFTLSNILDGAEDSYRARLFAAVKRAAAPDAAVVVATVRALKMHGGVGKIVAGKPLDAALSVENVDAVRAGAANLAKQIEHGAPADIFFAANASFVGNLPLPGHRANVYGATTPGTPSWTNGNPVSP